MFVEFRSVAILFSLGKEPGMAGVS